jgi:hypothetical protein
MAIIIFMLPWIYWDCSEACISVPTIWRMAKESEKRERP